MINIFIDITDISLKAGNGGDGAVSFHREKYVANGGPDGGDGGKGGDIIFYVDDNLSTLLDFRYKHKYIAENGDNGGTNKCSGKAAENMVIKVPRGTLVKERATGRLIADMSGDEPVVIAKGGKGGKGNQHFATPSRQIPRFSKPGFPGEELDVTLELKLLADVGLVGFPNVGKSTLISVVSAAKPKIANYHFTTLTPVLGVVSVNEKSFVMADIPGLIEGASEGIGLGHEFLRHVERCRLIIHVLDASGIEGRDPIEDFEKINAELSNYSPDLASRPQIVAANKTDMADEEQIIRLREYIQEKGYDFFEISAATTSGVKKLIEKTAAMLESLPPIKVYEAQPISVSQLKLEDNPRFKITVEDDIYIVNAPFLARILQNADMDDYESLQYFQRVLRSSGIIDELQNLGIQEGDTVSIFDFEFEFVN